MEKLAREAADRLGRKLGLPDLTAEEAEEFAELGRPQMIQMIERPVGITPAEYRAFLDGSGDPGRDLNFMLSLICGEHLNEDFLKHAK